MKISELEASGQPVCVGHGVLSVNHVRPVTDGFICTGARKQGVMERAECQNTAGTPQQRTGAVAAVQ